jgi:RecB family endonuclease NucS
MHAGPDPEDPIAFAGDPRAATVMFVRCMARYQGRIDAELELGDRLLMILHSGAVLLYAIGDGIKPKNWMPPGSFISHRDDDSITFVSPKGDESLEIFIDQMWFEKQCVGTLHGRLVKLGSERELSDLLTWRLDMIEPDLDLLGREWRTDVGPIDILCFSRRDFNPVAVEVKRIRSSIGSEVIYQLLRYMHALKTEEKWRHTEPRGVLVAHSISKPAQELLKRNNMSFVRLSYDDVIADWPAHLPPVEEIVPPKPDPEA